jgi:hypothetical protein
LQDHLRSTNRDFLSKVTDIQPSSESYHRVEPQWQFAVGCTDAAKPILPGTVELESSSSSGTYPSAGSGIDFSAGASYATHSEIMFENHPIPLDFSWFVALNIFDDSEQLTCIEEISEEESKLMKEYFNLEEERFIYEVSAGGSLLNHASWASV